MKLANSMTAKTRCGAPLSALPDPVEVTRTVAVHGERMALRLESDIWECFKAIAEAEGAGADDLATRIADKLGTGVSLTTGVRVFVLNHFRQTAPAFPAAAAN